MCFAFPSSSRANRPTVAGRTSLPPSGHSCVTSFVAFPIVFPTVQGPVVHVSSLTGGGLTQDLAGFPKGGSYWFRSQWLYSIPDTSPDKTFNTDGLADGRDHMIHIVEGWDDLTPIKITSLNKTYAEPCIGSSGAVGAETQQMTFLGGNTGGSGVIKNSAGLCVDPSACPADKVAHGGAGCFPLKFQPCKQSMSFTVGETGQLEI